MNCYGRRGRIRLLWKGAVLRGGIMCEINPLSEREPAN